MSSKAGTGLVADRRPSSGAPGGPALADDPGELIGIGAAAARAGVSERALRYYQQLGLLAPARTTPGGLRRYSAANLARVARIRELQTLLGLNLDEIALVLRNEDRIAQIRLEWHDERTSKRERRALSRESLALQENLRATVEAKRVALDSFLADLDTRIAKVRAVLASPGG
ncbi:MAG: MerR family transcriptional regulator [Streptosporangiaceae bacterium]